MAVNIAEFTGLALSRPDPNVGEYAVAQHAPAMPPLAVQAVTVGNGSAALDGQTTLLRIVSDVACFIDIGEAPVAGATTMYLPANTVEWASVPINSGFTVDTAAVV